MTSWATAIRTSLWAYPFIQLIHFSGLSLWLGTNVAGDLRLLGVGRKTQTAAEVRDELFLPELPDRPARPFPRDLAPEREHHERHIRRERPDQELAPVRDRRGESDPEERRDRAERAHRAAPFSPAVK